VPTVNAASPALGTVLDRQFVRLGLLTGKFFPLGWGDLNAINFHQDLSCMKEWPPAGIKMDKWKEVERGVFDGYGYKVFEGTYKTPCTARMYDALPPESRMGRVQLMVPDVRSGSKTGNISSNGAGSALGCALHLAATGDQGFSRRLRLARPLLQQGICSLVHESPFYNSRRPQAQRGSKLLRVSDLFVLGYATIYESVCLLHYLTRDGFDEGGLCMTGLSMGGVHACMTAAVYPRPVACTPLLAPRSAAAAYCDGALAAAMAWTSLLQAYDEKGVDVLQAVSAASQAVSWMGSANYVLGMQQSADGASLRQENTQSGGTLDAASCSSNGGNITAGRSLWKADAGSMCSPDGQAPLGDMWAVRTTASQPTDVQSSNLHFASYPHHHHYQQQQQQQQQQESHWSSLLASSPNRVLNEGSVEARVRLKNVLEAYTDISRFPLPRCPEAAVLVAADNDGYVSLDSVRELHRHWAGSELRMVNGGHVSAFIMHQDTFRQAIADSLCRLRTCRQQGKHE